MGCKLKRHYIIIVLLFHLWLIMPGNSIAMLNDLIPASMLMPGFADKKSAVIKQIHT